MFRGNNDGDSISRNEFEVPIIAQWIRINPTRWRDRISMRIQLYGCDYGMYQFVIQCVMSKLAHHVYLFCLQCATLPLFNIFCISANKKHTQIPKVSHFGRNTL